MLTKQATTELPCRKRAWGDRTGCGGLLGLDSMPGIRVLFAAGVCSQAATSIAAGLPGCMGNGNCFQDLATRFWANCTNCLAANVQDPSVCAGGVPASSESVRCGWCANAGCGGHHHQQQGMTGGQGEPAEPGAWGSLGHG